MLYRIIAGRRHWQDVWRTSSALRRGRFANLPGRDFGRFGQRIGLELLLRGQNKEGWVHLTYPLSSTRYFEFDFVRRHLPSKTGNALDVASPYLFSFYMQKHGRFPIAMLNPDPADVKRTRRLMSELHIKGVDLMSVGLEELPNDRTFDVVWSISVVEHVRNGSFDDVSAVRRMYAALRPGGSLLLTVPVDRTCWDEYRENKDYGVQRSDGTGRYFFQRFYDERTVLDLMRQATGKQPDVLEWYGEKTAGHFHEYIARWQKEGMSYIVRDPQIFADAYRAYPSWSEMPGVGVCGIVAVKPSESKAI